MIKLITQNCLICKQSSHALICQYCTEDLEFFDCEYFKHNLLLSPKVKSDLNTATFPQVLALCDYQWPIAKLITSLKFSAKLPNAAALASLFQQQCLSTLAVKPQAILPMPLHQNRFLTRKFNQSIEITKHLSRLSGIPMNTGILKRAKSTQQQTTLTAAQRRKNLKNAFTLDDAAKLALQKYQHVALFDDVITTGSTMNYAYKLLNEHQPELKIDVWSICITLTSHTKK